MRSSTFRLLLSVVLLAYLWAADAALSDNIYGSIRGSVTDASGAVIAGATVTAINDATGVSSIVTSGAEGNYEFLRLPAPANYTLRADLKGFRPFEARNLSLELNQIFVLNVTLEVGTVRQQVTVEAAATQVETTSIELGTQINSKTIVDLP